MAIRVVYSILSSVSLPVRWGYLGPFSGGTTYTGWEMVVEPPGGRVPTLRWLRAFRELLQMACWRLLQGGAVIAGMVVDSHGGDSPFSDLLLLDSYSASSVTCLRRPAPVGNGAKVGREGGYSARARGVTACGLSLDQLPPGPWRLA